MINSIIGKKNLMELVLSNSKDDNMNNMTFTLENVKLISINKVDRVFDL